MKPWNQWQQRIARGWMNTMYRSATARRLLWGILFAVLLGLLMATWMLPRRQQISVGQAAPFTVTAPRDLSNAISKGARIVTEGEPISPQQYRLLEKLGVAGPALGTKLLIGAGLLGFIVVFLAGIYLWRFQPKVLARDKHIFMLGVITLFALSAGLLANNYSGYLMPLAVGTMLLSVLLDARSSMMAGILLTLCIIALMRDDPGVALTAAVSTFVGANSLRRVEARVDLVRAGLWVAGVNVVTIIAWYLIPGRSLTDLGVWTDVGAGAANGILSAMLAIGLLPFLEGIFRVPTPMKLLELANSNQPLLKKLMVEAPGTYHHTLVVANMTEAAAEAIGADSTLARTGCLYHDIGKIKRPQFFTENQIANENPHDTLLPHMSALLISSHVKDGVEMAREHGLPEEIINFIREHHGDTLISYFYHKATENGRNEYVLEENFRYEGPRPRSRETAITMLADGCEASVRAIGLKGQLTPEQIEQQVHKIVQNRLQQHQLDECDLTLHDINIVKQTFVRILSGIHHSRIEYPSIDLPPGSAGGVAIDRSHEQSAGHGSGVVGTGEIGGAGGQFQSGADPGQTAE